MKFGTLHLFPLIKSDVLWASYFLDAQGNVYSERHIGRLPYRIHGSVCRSGRTKFKMNGANFYLDELQAKAQNHHDFKMETNQLANIKKQQPLDSDGPWAENWADDPAAKKSRSDLHSSAPAVKRSFASTAKIGISSRGRVIATVLNGKLVFGSFPAIHTTEASAKAEAERISALKPGLQVVILKIENSVTAGGFKWE